MTKYFLTWEADESLWPTDAKGHGALRSKLAEMVKQDMKEGKLNDWGVFVGGDKGYSVVKGNAVDIYKNLQRYHPYINFMVHEVLSIDELLEVAKSLTE